MRGTVSLSVSDYILAEVSSKLLLLGVIYILQKRSLLRGLSQSTLLKDGEFRLFRLFFFIAAFGPFIWLIESLHEFAYPVISICSMVYAYTYIDLSEAYGGRKNLFLQQSRLVEAIAGYFQLESVKPKPFLNPHKVYLFSFHPHGVLPIGSSTTLLRSGPLGVMETGGLSLRILGASLCFYAPIYRDFLLALGAIDASSISANRAFQMGHSVAVTPGGANEALYSSFKQDILLLRKKRGFIRLAIENGAEIVPVFTFNENSIFEKFDIDNEIVDTFQQKLYQLFGITLPLLQNVIPKKVKLTTVFGTPIFVHKSKHPSPELVDEYLATYINAVKQLYNEYKWDYNHAKNKELMIL